MMHRLLLCIAVLLCCAMVSSAQHKPAGINGNHELKEVKVQALKKQKTFLFSSFEKKIHISLNPHHDEYRYATGPSGKQPQSFTAASFLHNDTTAINLYKIEGRALPFDTAMVKVKVLVLQRGIIIAAWDLLPGMITKEHFTIDTGPVSIGTGEFYVLYVCSLREGAAFYVTVNPQKESARFSFNDNTGAASPPAGTVAGWKLPAPQFKVYAEAQ